jgi:hypothetical protein
MTQHSAAAKFSPQHLENSVVFLESRDPRPLTLFTVSSTIDHAAKYEQTRGTCGVLGNKSKGKQLGEYLHSERAARNAVGA